MSPTINLIVHNIVSVVSIITLLGITFFTFLNNPKKTANITLALTACAATIFAISHIIGVNITDPALSKAVLMFNLSILYIGVFQIHSILALLGKAAEKKNFLILVYSTAIILTVFFIIFPDLFLLNSAQKMYFPNYYVPGILNWVRLAFLFVAIIPFALYELYTSYKRTDVALEKQQYKYFMLAILFGYSIGFIPNFLIYNIHIDPIWGMAFGFLFGTPFVYGAIKYELYSVKIIAKQALLYSIAVSIIGAIIIALNYLNTALVETYPGFPTWSIALISALLLVTICVVVWRHLKESDILKYEFITTVTHKFRTPLTHIKWASENISQATTPDEISTQVGYIQSANTKLVELTNLLVNVSETENSAYEYHLEKGDISLISEEIISALESQVKSQSIQVIKNVPAGMMASVDPVRVKFVIQTLIENAIHYTPKNGTITISVVKQKNEITFSVTDSGIGIAKEELSRLFEKFYRGKQARMTDTEGMGIGLFISKQIIERHNGRIWAKSEGRDKGSTFSFAVEAVE
ncbi:MAG: HAMP domain-containing histidine kinase [bacterium]|nr:HAMP domain-containing histidine kinase [bacterium]